MNDFRQYVGHLGRALIAIGALTVGFVAYQLWGTGIEAARSQDQLGAEFEQNLDALTPATTLPSTVPLTGTTGVHTTSPPTSSTVVPAEQQRDLLPVVPDDALFKLEVPSIGLLEYVVPGVGYDALKRGPGHFPDSPLPGQLGKAAVAGHRTTFGAPFGRLDEVEAGDEFVVTRRDGNQYTFRVTGREVVAPSEYRVVTTEDPDSVNLTLATCHPEWTASERLAVHSVLVPDRSGPVGEATFYDVGTLPPTTAPPTTMAPATAATTSIAPATIAPAATLPAEPSSHVKEAFVAGWFDDPDAWPQIALWAAALSAIAAAGYWLSRRAGRNLIGVAAGIVPFLVALYFFYQNVNRLLPAGA